MAIKKSELYSSLWASCDALRGGMDASQYKDYVLVLLFVKYVSDKYAGKADAVIEIPEGGSFQDMVALKGKEDIGDGINKIIYRLAEANDLVGIITGNADFNDQDKLGTGQAMQDTLSKLVGIFQNPELDFSKNRADGDDILGDAYEYLMRNFATQSGKSKGQFYTPAEVSRVMAKILGINPSNSTAQTTVYDPTMGSASLLQKVADEAGKSVSLYGQEKEVATAGLAKMNMILHHHPTNEIAKGQSTLSYPFFLADGKLKTFDYVVANPPFSLKNWSDGFDPYHDIYERFTGYGVPPAKNGDYAFLLHIVRSLKSGGKGSVILPHGVLFRGNAEGTIRTALIKKGYIKGIIGLPANLFYGTGIPACIIVIDKENAEIREGIFMIDAGRGFVKDGNKNRLREQDIHKIVDVFTRQTELDKYSRLVPLEEIVANDYNLNIPRYIDSSEPEDLQDIEAHLLGDIPNADIDALQSYWEVYPSLRKKLFGPSGRKGYSKLKVKVAHIRTEIFEHDEFRQYLVTVDNAFTEWRERNVPLLQEIKPGDKPKAIIHRLSEDLLAAFTGKKLVDKYDIYQHLMTYWNENMQDDVYLLVTEGWMVGAAIEKTKKEWEGRLIPKVIITAQYFPKEHAALEALEESRDNYTRQIEELEDEHSGEDGLLAEALNDKGKVAKAAAAKRLKVLEKAPAIPRLAMAAEPMVAYGTESGEYDEAGILKRYLVLTDAETAAARKHKDAAADLEKAVQAKYKTLGEGDIKALVVRAKWMAHLQREVQNELDRISHRLARRIVELAERYETTLPKLAYDSDDLTEKVSTHLKQMGFLWQ
jgi:type I restriction enzyme M protein